MTIILTPEILGNTHLYETPWGEIIAISTRSRGHYFSPVFFNGVNTGRRIADFNYSAYRAAMELIDWKDKKRYLSTIEFDPAPADAAKRLIDLSTKIINWLSKMDKIYGVFRDLKNEVASARLVKPTAIMTYEAYKSLKNAEQVWKRIKNHHPNDVDKKEIKKLWYYIYAAQKFYENVEVKI